MKYKIAGAKFGDELIATRYAQVALVYLRAAKSKAMAVTIFADGDEINEAQLEAYASLEKP